jgi:ABC-type multidrug transport system fused ATPase/permease subunit
MRWRKGEHPLNHWKWLRSYIRDIRGSYYSSIVLEIISAIAALGIIAIQKVVIDNIFIGKQYDLILTTLLVFAAIILIYFLTHAVAFVLMRKHSAYFRMCLSKDLVRHYYAMPMQQFRSGRIAVMANYFSSEINTAAGLLSFTVMHASVSITKLLILVAVVGYTSLPVLGIVMICSFFFILQGKYFSPKLKQAAKEVAEHRSLVAVHIEEGISSSREVIAYHRQQWEKNKLSTGFAVYFRKVMTEAKLLNKEILLSEPLKWVAVLAVLGFCGFQVLNNRLSLGSLVILYHFASQLMDAATETYKFVTSSSSQMGSVERVKQILDGPRVKDGHRILQGSITSLSLENLHFRYNEDQQPVLNGVTIDIPISKKVAVVGLSGGGKSTLTQLLSLFYEPQEGDIYLNGNPLSTYRRKDWLERIAVVFQEPYLFPGTIRDNLRMGREAISDEELHQACKTAAISETITSLPKGLDTECGERGVNFSGGQRQRLALARALVGKPELLILDEATSALDMETERLVQRNLDEALKEVTILVIAHRLSTIRNADLIYVMDQGKVIESGTHVELLAMESVYYRLITSELAEQQVAASLV